MGIRLLQVNVKGTQCDPLKILSAESLSSIDLLNWEIQKSYMMLLRGFHTKRTHRVTSALDNTASSVNVTEFS